MRTSLGVAACAIVVAIVACSTGSPAMPSADATTTPAPSAPGGDLTYYADVKPIVDEKCAICHDNGGIAPFPLLSYSDVQAHALDIEGQVKARTMPPWPPSDACNAYLGDRSLSSAEIDTLVTWAAGAQAEGDPSSYAPLGDAPLPSLSRIDDELAMPEAFTPTESPDDYRCFLLDWPETATKYVTGFGAKPGQTSIVHHLLAYIVPPGEIATYQAYDAADPGPGYTCFGGPTGSLTSSGAASASGDAGASASDPAGLPQQVGGWVPGAKGADFAAGTGIRIAPGSKIVLQVHYNTLSAPPAADQTKLDFELADSVAKEAHILPFTNAAWPRQKTMTILAGDPDAEQSYTVGAGPWVSLLTKGALPSDKPFTVYSSLLHMHLHGTQTTLTVDHTDGTSACLLEIPRWNFHWQGTFALAQPMQVSPGDRIKIDCHWDNSAANQPVINGAPLPVTDLNWGEGTTDEMCLGFIYVTQ